MGSIQALRSEALAMRAKEDTNMQVAGYLGTVNKTLGSQITNLIDQLQGIIKERTKAYNASMAKVHKDVEGKMGIGDVAVKQAFDIVRTILDIIGALVTEGGNALEVADAAAKVISGWLALESAKHNFNSAVYSYEKAASQLGLNSGEPTDVGIPSRNAGAVKLVDLRDAIMPRYKPRDPAIATNTANPAYDTGYVGTLRRV